MVALIIQTEEELAEIEKKADFRENEVLPVPGIYYEHMGEWCARYLYDLDMMDQFGYILARPVTIKEAQKMCC